MPLNKKGKNYEIYERPVWSSEGKKFFMLVNKGTIKGVKKLRVVVLEVEKRRICRKKNCLEKRQSNIRRKF